MQRKIHVEALDGHPGIERGVDGGNLFYKKVEKAKEGKQDSARSKPFYRLSGQAF